MSDTTLPVVSRRLGRQAFLALAILPLINLAALLLYGLELSTGGGEAMSEAAVPFIVVLAAANGLLALFAAIRRGRDLGWPSWATVLALWLGGPLDLLILAYMGLAPAKPGGDRFGPPSGPAGWRSWYASLGVILGSWALLMLIYSGR